MDAEIIDIRRAFAEIEDPLDCVLNELAGRVARIDRFDPWIPHEVDQDATPIVPRRRWTVALPTPQPRHRRELDLPEALLAEPVAPCVVQLHAELPWWRRWLRPAARRSRRRAGRRARRGCRRRLDRWTTKHGIEAAA